MVELEYQNYEKNTSLFNILKKNLFSVLTNVISIDHVGSTAIENMYGKNIIDILIGVKNQHDFDITYGELLDLGYFPSKRTESSFYHFFASTESETKSGDIHIHLCIINTERYDEFLILKEYLLNNPKEAEDYSNFKLKIVNNGIIDRNSYRLEKSKYVSDLIARAKKNRN